MSDLLNVEPQEKPKKMVSSKTCSIGIGYFNDGSSEFSFTAGGFNKIELIGLLESMLMKFKDDVAQQMKDL